jgi:cell division protein ZapE
MSVYTVYLLELQHRGFHSDPAQLRAIEALERCADEWSSYKHRRSNAIKKLLVHPPIPRGVYLYGGVGRGKSFLMDCFFDAVPLVRKTRLHFHEFMREVHHQLNELKGLADPLDELARRMARRHRLLCFDEFHVADITDALILHRLLSALFENGVGFVTTSNFKPDDLYPDGMHRDRLLPAIDLLNEKLDIVSVDNGIDYRLHALADAQFYLSPGGPQADAKMASMFHAMARVKDQEPVLTVEGRSWRARRLAGRVAWFDFSDLCGDAHSQNDFLELAERFDVVFVSDVPVMDADMASEARRLTWLVDVLYDRQVRLVVSAAVPPEGLYLHGPQSHEFPRTVSRLHEMTAAVFGAGGPRHVDTALV